MNVYKKDGQLASKAQKDSESYKVSVESGF